MPKRRVPFESWNNIIRPLVWNRDKRSCTRCKEKVSIETCHIDHIISGKRGSNRISNLRTLCRACHVLRADPRHRGMIAKAIKDKVIPPDWRSLVWEE